MTKHCSFSMISESRAGSSKKSKSRYDCLDGSRAAGVTSDFQRGVFKRQRGKETGEWGDREVYRSFGNFKFSVVYVNYVVLVLALLKSAPHNGYSGIGLEQGWANSSPWDESGPLPFFHGHKLRMGFAFFKMGEERRRIFYDVKNMWKSNFSVQHK